MDDLIWVVIYVVIMVVGFLARQAKRQNVKQPQAKRQTVRPSQSPKTASRSSQDMSVKFEQYFTQIEKAFTSPQPPVLPQQPQNTEIVSEVVREEEYEIAEGPRKKMAVVTQPIVEDAMTGTSLSSPGSLVLFKRPGNVVQGLVMAEVLGPPVSKRQGRGRKG